MRTAYSPKPSSTESAKISRAKTHLPLEKALGSFRKNEKKLFKTYAWPS
jgi:hypothetical protein